MIAIIVLILVGVGGYVFYGYIQSSYQVKSTNTARKIYDAAESYLSDAKAAETLEEVNKSSRKYGGSVSLDKEKAILSSLHEVPGFDSFYDVFKKNYRDVPIRYLLLPAADKEDEEREENPILTMLEYAIPDENIKKHTILIEYNGNTGEVLGVLYSEKTETFTYEGDTSEKGNALLRDEKSLEKKWQGYFGMDLEEL